MTNTNDNTAVAQAAEDRLAEAVESAQETLKAAHAEAYEFTCNRTPETAAALRVAFQEVLRASAEKDDGKSQAEDERVLCRFLDKVLADNADLEVNECEDALAALDKLYPPKLLECRDVLDWHDHDEPVSVLRGPRGGLLYRGEVAVLSGEGGIGKSTLAMQWAAGCAIAEAAGLNEVRTAGMVCKPGKALVLSFEDNPKWVANRGTALLGLSDLQGPLSRFPQQRDALQGRLKLVPMRGRPLFSADLSNRYPERTKYWDAAWNMAKGGGTTLVVVDPATSAFVADANRVESVRAFMDALHEAAADGGFGILLVAHPAKAARRPKDADDAALVGGSAAWTDAARAAMHFGGGSVRKLKVLKCNYGPKAVGLLDEKSNEAALEEVLTGDYGQLRGFREVPASSSDSDMTGKPNGKPATEEPLTEESALAEAKKLV